VCIGEWTFGGTVCVGECTYVGNVVLVMDIWRYCVCW